MPEPATVVTIGLTGTGLTVLGLATGLQPMLLIAGMAGGWWALTCREKPMPLTSRIASVSISSIGAAWCAPVAVALIGASRWWPQQVSLDLLPLPVAMALGRIAYTALGSSLDSLVKRKMEGVQ